MNEQATFPDNPPIWLMDIASMLNLKLQMAEDSDPILQGKPPGNDQYSDLSVLFNDEYM